MGGLALVVPVFKNIQGFAELMQSVDYPILPIVIPNWEENIGVSAGWNAGIKKSIELHASTTIVSNDDLVFYPKTINKLVSDINNYKADLVSACNRRDVPAVTGIQYDEQPDFSCFAINPIRFVEKFGWFDEEFTPAYFEDNDMAYRIKLANGTYLRRLDAGVYHHGSVTQNWGGQQYVTGPMFEANRDYYISKWGGNPGSEVYHEPFQGGRWKEESIP